MPVPTATPLDKIEAMQAGAGAMDELLQSGVLEDVSGNADDIAQELDNRQATPGRQGASGDEGRDRRLVRDAAAPASSGP